MSNNKYQNSQQQQSDFNSSIQLDSEFDQHLANMKKHILSLSDKQSKQNCALWIKKLCEISDNQNIITKQIRNSYSFSLLKNLENNEPLAYPFSEKPPNGSLTFLNSDSNRPGKQNFPRSNITNNSSFHNNNNTTQDTSYQVPDIKRLNLESATSSDNDDFARTGTNERRSVFDERDYNSSFSESPERFNEPDSEPKILNFNTDHKNHLHNNHSKRDIDSTDLQKFVMTMNQQSESQKANLEKQKNFQIQQLEFHIKKLESKFQEEKLDAQHQHNLEIQKLMDRKNQELESLKKDQRSKSKENESHISSLERKLSQMAKQLSAVQADCDRRINELTNETSHVLEMNQKDSDKKFKDLFYAHEKEKSYLQKQHTSALQLLVEETNGRLRNVESEYNEQQAITDRVVRELESRTQLLKSEMEKNLRLIEGLQADKTGLEQRNDTLEKEINEVKKKCQASLAKAKESHSQEVEGLRKRMEAENEKRAEREAQERAEAEKGRTQLEKKNQRLVGLVREREQSIEELKESIRKQDVQTENALNDIKLQVEENSKKIYAEMNEAMGKCEQELARSKQARDKQAKESQRQMDKVRGQHEREVHRLRQEFAEAERALKAELDEEKKSLMRQNCEQITELKEKHLESNFKYQAKIETLSSTICQQEQKIGELQRQVTDANALRKTQIIELGILREDEKVKLIREKDVELQALKKEMEVCKKSRRDEIARLREAQKEEIKRVVCGASEEKKAVYEQIEVLEEAVRSVKADNQRLVQMNEQAIKEAFGRLESERNCIKKPYQNRIMKLEKEVEFYKKTKDQLEFELNMASSDYETSLTKLKMHYEERQKGLLPQDLKNEFEETISSLKSQVQILQQRTSLLQTELDDRNHLINSSASTASI